MGSPQLPLPVDAARRRRSGPRNFLLAFSALLLASLSVLLLFGTSSDDRYRVARLPYNANELVSKCAALKEKPRVPPGFSRRTESDRFVPGTEPVLIHNATIWTGSDNGEEVLQGGDVLLVNGLIKWVGGSYLEEAKKEFGQALVLVQANGKWVTPGIVDLHSHLGVDSVPALDGAADTNSLHGITQPWLRSMDGLNTHDEALQLSISGGVTSANILPGSANAIGGQAYPIKLRTTGERSVSSKLIEQIGSPNSTGWRQMKHACGENPSRVYSGTRMDTIWAFREAYNEARKLVRSQDAFCAKVEAAQWDLLAADGKDAQFPEDLKWEALADVIRGKVKVHNHCYEAVDFDGIVRLTNEFQFPIAAFHHAHEAYLVPDLIKKTWGDEPPAIAIFATNARYKKEAFRGSEFAASILASHNLSVVMKSDHPVLNSRHLLWEAQQAFYYGLPSRLALGSVTAVPATVLGLGHRIGFIKEGWDADVVMWDSHPLALGATPAQVYIDGIPQIEKPFVHEKPLLFQVEPRVPNWDRERDAAIKYEGLPPLLREGEDWEGEEEGKEGLSKTLKDVVFEDVASVWVNQDQKLTEQSVGPHGVVVVSNGRITCMGTHGSCSTSSLLPSYELVNLAGGCLTPGFISFGSPLGLVEIDQEPSTRDGNVFDPLKGEGKAIAGGDAAVVRAVDGLQFATRDALVAYRAGVTSAITPPDGSGPFRGLGVFFNTGRAHALEPGAIIRHTTGFHFALSQSSTGQPSISTQLATLRRLLLFPHSVSESITEIDRSLYMAVAEGSIPLIIHVSSADAIASVLRLKREVEDARDVRLRVTLVGAEEAHLLAREIADADVGVILVPVRPFPAKWASRRILPGPPRTELSSVASLLKHGVTVGIGVVEAWEARNARFDAAWAALDIPPLAKSEVLALISSNLRTLLGAETDPSEEDIVAFRGGDMFEMSSKVVGVVSPMREAVELWE